VLLEAAHFAPDAVAGRARRLGLFTDAAQRFERGVDPTLPALALERAAALLLEIAGGEAGPVHVTRAEAASGTATAASYAADGSRASWVRGGAGRCFGAGHVHGARFSAGNLQQQRGGPLQRKRRQGGIHAALEALRCVRNRPKRRARPATASGAKCAASSNTSRVDSVIAVRRPPMMPASPIAPLSSAITMNSGSSEYSLSSSNIIAHRPSPCAP